MISFIFFAENYFHSNSSLFYTEYSVILIFLINLKKFMFLGSSHKNLEKARQEWPLLIS